jgi:hypothetical protein
VEKYRRRSWCPLKDIVAFRLSVETGLSEFARSSFATAPSPAQADCSCLDRLSCRLETSPRRVCWAKKPSRRDQMAYRQRTKSKFWQTGRVVVRWTNCIGHHDPDRRASVAPLITLDAFPVCFPARTRERRIFLLAENGRVSDFLGWQAWLAELQRRHSKFGVRNNRGGICPCVLNQSLLLTDAAQRHSLIQSPASSGIDSIPFYGHRTDIYVNAARRGLLWSSGCGKFAFLLD